MKKNWPIVILILSAIFLCFQNYTPGTFLSGWDTLHPEFNFWLNINREIFGVFRSYQGLGAVAAHSDMADLPRIILLFLLSPFIPMSFLRYSYVFLNLILGPIGMYFFLRYIFVISIRQKPERNPIGISRLRQLTDPRDDNTLPSFLGALFYLLNLGAMQQFIVPFEMFVTQYASLPWLFLFATTYIYNKTHQKRTLLLFALVTLFSAPMAYAATLWYMYFITFILYVGLLSLLLSLRGAKRRSQVPYGTWRSNLIHLEIATPVYGLVRNDKKGETTTFQTGSSLAKKAFTLILLTLLINSFWILPNIYFVFTHGSEVPKANINKLFSEQAFLYNKEFGNIADISLLKTFLFDWNIYSGNNNFVQLLSQWIAHLKQPFVQLSGFLFAGIAFFGIIYGIFNPFDKLRVNAERSPAPSGTGRSRSIKKDKILIALLPLLFLCLFFLFNDNSPTSSLYSFLQAKVPFLKEAYRFPQNKVLGIFTFLFAIYFAAGQLFVMRLLKSSLNAKINRHSGLTGYRLVPVLSRISHRGWRFWSRFTPQNDGRWVTLEFAQMLIFAMLLFYFMLPAFKGNFISPYMRIKIPNYYFEMFSWFNKEKEDGTIANLPINSFWGWEYHNWSGLSQPSADEGARLLDRRGRGLSFSANKTNSIDDQVDGPSFQGAGFIWFGIKQPLLARDFDRWSPYNEQYYREMSYAIYSQDPTALKIVLEKYNIKYILLDKSITAQPNPAKVLLYQETQELLGKQDYIQKVKEFDNTLFVYRVKSNTPNDTAFIQNPALIHLESQVFYEDVAYKDYGNYIAELGNVYYPLANLIDNQSRILPNTLRITQEGVVIRLPKDRIDNLSLPSFLDTQELVASDLLIEKNNNKLIITFYPHLPIKDSKDHLIPIVVEADLSKIENIILSINKKDNFTLNLTPNIPLSLGTIYLNTKNENTIAIYPSTPNEKILPDLSAIKYYIEPCQDIADQKIFGGYSLVPSFGVEKIQNNSFNIFAKNVPLCVTFPLSEVIQKDLKYSEILLNVTFDYELSVPLKFCISKLINGACQNYRNNGLVEYFGLQKEDTKNLGLQFLLDPTNSDQDKIVKAFYSNIVLNVTYPIFTDKLSLRHSGNQASPEHPESLPHPNPLPEREGAQERARLLDRRGQVRGQTLILPYSGSKELSADITKFPITSGYCPKDLVSNSALIKKQILENNNDRFIRYESLDGLSCDHFSYQNLSQNEAYLVAITSRNVKGLPLTLCMTNHVSKHCDIYANLSSYKDFNTDIFLLPPQIKNEIGFDVNISNLGIKKSPAINDLKSIEIIPFPYKWLSQIRHYPHPDPLPRGEGIKRDPLSREVGEGGGEGRVLILPQSFEKGWKAYEVENGKWKVESWLKTFLPFVFGKEIKNHVLVNNWSNGWILENSQLSTLNSQLIIVFLPQYLEYIGFLFLLGTFTYLIVHGLRNKSRTNP